MMIDQAKKGGLRIRIVEEIGHRKRDDTLESPGEFDSDKKSGEIGMAEEVRK